MKSRSVVVALSFVSVALLLTGCEWSACFGDCDNATDDPCEEPVTYTVRDATSPNSIVPKGTFYSIDVIGSGSLILIGGRGVACEVRIEGQNNLIRFETADHTVRVCRFLGNDNTIERPSAMALVCEDGGVGNTLLVY